MKAIALKVWWWMCLVGTFFMLRCRIYYVWSRLGDWLFERRYLNRQLKQYDSLEELEQTIGKWVWRPDPWWQLGDMFSCPGKVECAGFDGKSVGDCDDFSRYAADRIEDMRKRFGGTVGRKFVRNVSLLTVPWMGPGGKVSGHNVCVFEYQSPTDPQKWIWAWISNWYKGKARWSTTAGLTYSRVAEIAAEICAGFQGCNLGYARVSIDLKKLLEHGRV